MTTSSSHHLIETLEQAIWARQGAKESGEIRFLCPAHDDHHPSARWNPEKQTWYCDVCNEGGGYLDLAKRFDIPITNGSNKKKIVATYDYMDEQDQLLFQVVRFEPKEFKQRAPKNGDWVWSLKGVRRVLYKLPQVLTAIEAKRFILVAEGEKDVESLMRLGFAATCNSQGAGKWRKEYAGTLKGAQVAILPDKDAPGRKHGQDVAQSLQGLAKSIRLVELPGQGKDPTDWISAGGTAEDLKRLILETPEWRSDQVSAEEQLRRELEVLKEENRRLKGGLLVDEDASRDDILHVVTEQLGVKVSAIYKYEQEISSYEMVVEDKRVLIGGIEKFLMQKPLELRIADACGRLIRHLTYEQWRRVVDLMLRAQEVRSVDEASSLETLQRWLGSYLSQNPPVDESSSTPWQNAAIADRPFVYEGDTYISLMGLRNFLKRRHSEVVTVPQLAELMTKHSINNKRIWGTTQSTPARNFRRRFWLIPTEFMENETSPEVEVF